MTVLLSALIDKFRQTWRHGRNRSILTYFVTSISGRGIGILCQLVQVPFALHYLGKEAFGVWLTLGAISYLISFSDLGVGMGAQNQITEALGVGDKSRARKLFMTTLVFLCAIALVLAVVGIPVSLLLHWGAIFKVKDPVLTAALPGAMTGFLVLVCINFPMGMSRRLAYASQQSWIDNVLTSASTVLGLAAVFIGAHLRLGFQNYVIITWIPVVLAPLALLVYQFISMNWLRASGPWFDRAAMRGLLNLGLLFGVQQVCILILFGGPPILISTMLGAAALAPYNLVQRIFNIFQMFQNAFLLPLWPAYADAKAKGDWHWMARTLSRSMWATVWVALAPMVGISFVIRPLIKLWTGSDATLPSDSLVVLLLLWNIVVALQQPLGFLLAGVSEVKRNTVYSILTTISAGALMPLLAPRYGINGIVFGLLVGNATFSLTGCAYEVWRYLRLAKAKIPAPGSRKEQVILATVESAP